MINSRKGFLAGIIAFLLLTGVFVIGPQQIKYTLAGITMKPASENEKQIARGEAIIDATVVVKEKSDKTSLERAINRLSVCADLMDGGKTHLTKLETDLIYCLKFSKLSQVDGSNIFDPQTMEQAILRYLTIGLGFNEIDAARTIFQWGIR
jgi:hypothetical protein